MSKMRWAALTSVCPQLCLAKNLHFVFVEVSHRRMSTFYDESVDEQVREQIFKIIIIGDSNVGKTCLAYRFCTGRFPERTEATIGVDFCEKKLTIDGENLKVICLVLVLIFRSIILKCDCLEFIFWQVSFLPK